MTHLPNAITLGRLLAVPFVVFFILSNAMELAFWVFVAASFSDAVDGYLARRFNFHTNIGKYLDPLADKALLVAVFITLASIGRLPLYLVILVVLRDIQIFIGALHLKALGKEKVFAPSMVSKMNTLFQMMLVTMVLAREAFCEINIPHNVVQTLLYIALLTTIFSSIGYIQIWRNALKSSH